MPNRPEVARGHSIDVSVVVPVRDEAPSVRSLFGAVEAALAGRRFEVVFVDDGSADGSADVLRDLARHDPRARVIELRGHFGKAAALSVGFRNAHGSSIVTMDGDMQDDPADIPAMLELLSEGVDLVSGWKSERRDPWTRRAASRVFNRATRMVTGMALHDFNCGLKAYTAECAKEVATSCYGELHRYLPVIARDRGFRVAEMAVRHHARLHGRSRYGFERYIRGLLDLLTVLVTSRFARRPAHVLGAAGMTFVSLGVAGFVWLGIQRFALGGHSGALPLAAASMLTFTVGVQLLIGGVVAETVVAPRVAVPFSEMPLFQRPRPPREIVRPALIVLPDTNGRKIPGTNGKSSGLSRREESSP